MDVVYAAGSGNVGDELNAWLWSSLLGDHERQHSGDHALLVMVHCPILTPDGNGMQ